MIRLALRVPAAQAEMVLAELLDVAPAGVEETELPAGDGHGAQVEYAIYGAPGELPQLPDLQAAVGGVPVEVSTSELPDDWPERWKRFHRPVLVRGPEGMPALHVRPPWCEPAGGNVPGATEHAREESAGGTSAGCEDVQEVVIDPGQAFGTGAHATTRLCLELLVALAAAERTRGPLVDVGAGSGVLAIAAARLGYGPVLALDNERESVAAIEANAAVNGVQVQARRFDLRREPLPGLGIEDASPGQGRPALRGEDVHPGRGWPGQGRPGQGWPGQGRPIVLANLLRPLLFDLAASMECPPAHLIAGGLLREEADEVAAAFSERLSLRERERRQRGDWAALWLA